MEGAGKGKGRWSRAVVPRAREDGLPTTATRGYSMMNGTEGAASRDRRQSNGGRLSSLAGPDDVTSPSPALAKQRGKFIGDGRQQIRGREPSIPGVRCTETVPDAATARHDESKRCYIKTQSTTDKLSSREKVLRFIAVFIRDAHRLPLSNDDVSALRWWTLTNCFCDVRCLTAVMKEVLIRNRGLNEPWCTKQCAVTMKSRIN